MNGKRIILGGLAAGLVMAVFDALTNAVLFKRDWADAYAARCCKLANSKEKLPYLRWRRHDESSKRVQ